MGAATTREERLVTADGYQLGLFHSPAPGGEDRAGRPVLLVHGTASNRWGFGVLPEARLAAALNQAGRDAWLLDFRGTRSSRWLGRGKPPLGLVQKLELDLPAAIDRVLAATGAAQLDLVGHSIGGSFAYYVMGGPSGRRVGRAVTLCAPLGFGGFLGWRGRVAALPLHGIERTFHFLPGFGIDRLARVRGPIPHAVAMVQHARLGTSDARARRAYLDHAVEDMPGADIAALCGWIRRGHLPRPGGGTYEGLALRVTQPVLAIAAARDPLVPCALVERGLQALGSVDKRFLAVGRRHGASREYAHADVLLAPSAAQDVYPAIVGWLCAGETRAEPIEISRDSRARAR